MLLGTVLVLFLLGGAGTASAHAAFRDSDPKDGVVLKSAPRQVTLTFTESVSLLDDSIRVLDPENRAVETGEPSRVGKRSDTVRATLPAGLDDGTYTIAWRVVSADSHPVSGALIFSIGEPSATRAVATTPTEDPIVASLYNIARYVAYGGLALLIGVTVFTALLGGVEAALRTLLLAGWSALLASTAALLLLRGSYERGTGVTEVLDPSVLADTATTRPGLALLARLVLLAGAFFCIRFIRGAGVVQGVGAVRETGPRQKAVLGAGVALSVGLALTWAAAEHASAGIQVPAAMTSSVLHLLAMAAWLGGLTALLTVLYRAPESLSATVVARFSRLAFLSVTVLVLTGVYQSWRGLGSWAALTETTYGKLLIAKLCAVLLLLTAAGLSRRWTARWVTAGVRDREPERETVQVEARVPERVGGGPTETKTDTGSDTHTDTGTHTDTDTGTHTDTDTGTGTDLDNDTGTSTSTSTDPDPGPHTDAHRLALRRSVLAEFAVAVVVMLITTVLTVTLPGRAAAESAESGGSAGTTAPGAPTASSSLIPFDVGTPNGHGKVQLDLGPGTVGKNSIQAVIFGPDGGIATVPEMRVTFTLRAQDVGPIDAKLTNRGGYWATDTLRLPLPGTWTMKITIRTTDIDQVTVEKNVRVS
ncbi:copper resistance CopC/CopD family protein [Streptomyces bluensis]|uniref:copper resistance CopC/CopD family protein n=1 Tax=Streptomyces bluensis TaxID=33897 RepID=UPI00167271C8|nr:copper resistance protein CopC [Streptomyces bluensis]GGZ84998.1 transport integral membrane protein [Streptomyces bluensis]